MRSRARLLEAMESTLLFGFVCDADLVDATACTELFPVDGHDVEIVQIHALVAGVDGAARLARILRLDEISTDHDGTVRWRSWTGWINLGPDDALLSIGVTAAEVVNTETSASVEIPGWRRSTFEELS